MTSGDELDGVGAKVVPCPFELRSRVAEAHDEELGTCALSGRAENPAQRLFLFGPGRAFFGRGGTFGLARLALSGLFGRGLRLDAWRLTGDDERFGI